MFCILIRLNCIMENKNSLCCAIGEILSIASIEDEINIRMIFRAFKNGVLIYLSSVQNFEMNIKAACVQGGVSQYKRPDLTALMKLHEKLLINIKKSMLGAYTCYFGKKRRIRCSIRRIERHAGRSRRFKSRLERILHAS